MSSRATHSSTFRRDNALIYNITNQHNLIVKYNTWVYKYTPSLQLNDADKIKKFVPVGNQWTTYNSLLFVFSWIQYF